MPHLTLPSRCTAAVWLGLRLCLHAQTAAGATEWSGPRCARGSALVQAQMIRLPALNWLLFKCASKHANTNQPWPRSLEPYRSTVSTRCTKARFGVYVCDRPVFIIYGYNDHVIRRVVPWCNKVLHSTKSVECYETRRSHTVRAERQTAIQDYLNHKSGQ